MRDILIKKKNIQIVYALLFALFCLLNSFTPFQGDDYTYAFNFVDHTPIRDLWDVIESQYVHFHTANGRTIPHLLEQTFAGITGKWAFNVFNSFLMIGLIYLVVEELKLRKSVLSSYPSLVMTATLFAAFFLFSFPGQSIFWMAGGLNYLLPAVLAIVVIRLFRSEKNHSLVGLFFLALVSGWCQEAISIPVAATLGALFFLYKIYSTKKNAIILFGYVLGTALIVFSPGTMTRLSSGELHTTGSLAFVLVNKLLETNACLHGLTIFWIALLMIVVLVVRRKWAVFKRSREMYILWGMNLLFFLALGFPHERITLFFSIVSFILVAELFLPWVVEQGKLPKQITTGLLLTLSGAGMVYALHSTNNYKKINDRLMVSIIASPSMDVVVPIEEKVEPSRYIYPLVLSKGSQSGFNPSLAAYLGKSSVQFLEPKLYNAVKEIMKPNFKDKESTTFVAEGEDCVLYEAKGMYYIKLPSLYYEKKVKAVAQHKVNNENLKWRQQMIRTILHSLDDGQTKLDPFIVLKSDYECYCFIPSIAKKEFEVELKLADEDEVICRLKRV